MNLLEFHGGSETYILKILCRKFKLSADSEIHTIELLECMDSDKHCFLSDFSPVFLFNQSAMSKMSTDQVCQTCKEPSLLPTSPKDWNQPWSCISCSDVQVNFYFCGIITKMTGKTPEVCSDKRKPREERQRKERKRD